MINRLFLPIYKFFILSRYKPVRLPHIDIYKLFGQLTIGAFFVGNIAIAAQANADTVVVTPPRHNDQPAHYLAETGFVDSRALDLEQQQTKPSSWVTSTTRLSRGFSSGHHALDVDGEFGDPINAFRNGEITLVSNSGPLGNHIVIQHKNGLTTVYAHLQSMHVESGQFVRAGEIIGTMGSTGRSTGSHLHFEAYQDGQIFDPATLF